MHQKQPPAKVALAVAVLPGLEAAAWATAVRVKKIAAIADSDFRNVTVLMRSSE
jgi:hypothetical protein